jgi:hypothetical protein
VSYLAVLDDAMNAAQEALDLWSMRGDASLVIEAAESQHVVWWTENADIILRVIAVSDLGVAMSVSATVTDTHGNEVPQPALPALQWHPSFRYFRLLQTTADLFDAYRNLYLALESLLATVVPMRLSAAGKPAEREGAWLRRGLDHVHQYLFDLTPYVHPGATGDPVQLVSDDLYTATRTALFHSKSGRPVLLPHGTADRSEVLESLDRLARLYLRLAAEALNARRASSAMTYAGFDIGFDMMTQFDATIAVSDDPSPASKSDTVLNPASGSAAVLTTRLAPELSKPGLKFWIGEVSAGDLVKSVSPVCRLGLLVRDHLLVVDAFEGDSLDPAGVTRFEATIGLRLVNRDQPRFRYDT